MADAIIPTTMRSTELHRTISPASLQSFKDKSKTRRRMTAPPRRCEQFLSRFEHTNTNTKIRARASQCIAGHVDICAFCEPSCPHSEIHFSPPILQQNRVDANINTTAIRSMARTTLSEHGFALKSTERASCCARWGGHANLTKAPRHCTPSC